MREENGCVTGFCLLAKPATPPRTVVLRPRQGSRTRASPLRQSTREQRSTRQLTDAAYETKKRESTKKALFPSTRSACVGRDSHNSFQEFCRGISTPRLNALQHFHLAPINVIISHGPITIPNLGVGFPLRCFQRLSFPDIATGRCHWRDSPQTRGRFISVLSY